MADLARLLEVVRAKRVPRSQLRIHVRTELREAFDVFCREEDLPKSSAIEAIVWGLVRRHPSALAMIDDWRRERAREERPSRQTKLTAAELREVHAAAGSVMIEEED